MRTSTYTVLRLLLTSHLDGLTVSEISLNTKFAKRSIWHTLRNMPDVYIDRWTKSFFQAPSQAVWCIVEVPEHCPKPTKGNK